MAKQKMLHDDDGHLDDRRIGGLALLLSAVGLAIADLFGGLEAQPEIVTALIYGGALLLGSTVAEKFGNRPENTQ
jgi:hypothetical protein